MSPINHNAHLARLGRQIKLVRQWLSVKLNMISFFACTHAFQYQTSQPLLARKNHANLALTCLYSFPFASSLRGTFRDIDTICTTWRSFPFTSRLLFSIYSKILELKISLHSFYRVIFSPKKSSTWIWRLLLAWFYISLITHSSRCNTFPRARFF